MRLAVALLLVSLIVASRLAHTDLIWIEEAYGMAAAAEMLRGRTLYSEIWFDKPPLYALFYAAFGSLPGWPLRIAGAVLVLFSCWAAYWLASRRWSWREGTAAAALLGLSLTFWIPSAVIAAAPDLLMLAPHILAVHFAMMNRPFVAGIIAGVALFVNAKGLAVLAACGIWAWPRMGLLLTGAAVPLGGALLLLPVRDYWEQVWVWGSFYSSDTFIRAPLLEGLKRTANWIGFHATAVLGAAFMLRRDRDWRMAAWLAISLAAVIAGLRFFPRYYFQVLPVACIAGARGLMLMSAKVRTAVCLLLIVPFVRFAPRYFELHDPGWGDTALMRDSRQMADLVRSAAQPGDTLFVWGYRPDVYVFSGLPAGSPFLDSQPLTGVFADRHLVDATPSIPPADASRNRIRLMATRPTFIVDGLGPANPRLSMTAFPDFQPWLDGYREAGRTGSSVLYRSSQ